MQKISGYLLAIDFEKAFDSLNHKISHCGPILLTNQESCVINGGHIKTYFRLERGARQGDSISPYLFVLALELFFISIKSNKNIHGINRFDRDFLYTSYADNATFFLKDLDLKKNVLEMLDQCYMVSALRPNFRWLAWLI